MTDHIHDFTSRTITGSIIKLRGHAVGCCECGLSEPMAQLMTHEAKRTWIEEASATLMGEPFGWDEDPAREYASSLFETYGTTYPDDPTEAIEDDRQYWEE